MKFIDDKGRIFGKFNLLDLIVLVFIAVVVLAIGSKLISNPESYGVSSDSNVEDMYVTVKCQGVTQDFIDNIAVGDKLIAQNAYTGGEVYAISDSIPYEYTGVDDNGDVVLSQHPYLKDVYVTVATTQDTSSPILKANGQEVRIGTKIFFKTQKVEVPAMVMDIDFGQPDSRDMNDYTKN